MHPQLPARLILRTPLAAAVVVDVRVGCSNLGSGWFGVVKGSPVHLPSVSGDVRGAARALANGLLMLGFRCMSRASCP